MTISTSPQATTQPLQAAPPGDTGPQVRRRSRGRLWLALLGVVILFVGTYFFAWLQASRLSDRFMANADTSYAAGDYLRALVGYEEFDEARNEYVTYGGYVQVERIFSHPNSWPQSSHMATAAARVTEILDTKLTTEDAENFIQANTGKSVPYFGEVYVRLGELYEADGDTRDARDIYESVAELFPTRQDLIERAAAGLARVGTN